VVLARDGADEQRLVAYVVPRQEPVARAVDSPQLSAFGSGELRDFLRDRLPDYMLPAAFVPLAALPLTPSGKLDRRALLAIEPNRNEPHGTYAPPRNGIEQELARIWSDLLAIEAIGVTDDFFELGGHSLLGVRLMARIEEHFGHRPPLAALFQGATIEQLARVIRRETQSQMPDVLVPIQPNGNRRPFFCVHPAGGSVLRYAGLARQLGAQRPFYGLQARGIEAGQPPHGRIEEMAAHYIAAIRAVQPQGPYLLGGWSLGGVVAFEMARILRAEGQTVLLLVLLDSRRSHAAYGSVGTADEAGLHAMFLREAGDGLMAGSSGSSMPRVDSHFFDVFKAHIAALGYYAPQPYDGRIALLRARDEIETRHYEPALGWSELSTQPIDIRVVPGNHFTMLEPPHLQALAAELRMCIECADVDESAKGQT
jgi:thioesterase domain-containing protein/acyl carrier protein